MPATKLIIGEGASDAAFFEHLLAERQIDGYRVHPRADKDSGNGYFKRALNLIPELELAGIKLIVLAADNDSDCAKSFKGVAQLVRDTKRFGVPRKPGQVTPSPKDSPANPVPKIVVLMMPDNHIKGCLETLCYESAAEAWPKLAECVDAFADCVSAKEWEPSKLSKLKLSSLLAAACKENPTISLKTAWSDDRRCRVDLVPLKNKCFDKITNQLLLWHRQHN